MPNKKEIYINYGCNNAEQLSVNGLCSVSQEIIKYNDDKNDEKELIKISGVLQLKTYIEDIYSIGFKWNDKIIVIENVEVLKESFGSDDEVCLYDFIAETDCIKVVKA